MTRSTLIVLGVTSCLIVAGCASAPTVPPVVQPTATAAAAPAPAPAAPAAPASAAVPPPSFFDRKLDRGNVMVGGQPTEADLARFKEQGVTRIVNLRTPDEMKGVPFDEPAHAAELGLAYVNLPVGGIDAYTPELLEAFAREVERGEGRVVLHCTVGARAGWLYTAYAIKYLGQSPEEALAALTALNLWPHQLERMLGRPLTLQFKDTP